ncbi:hypothetical protein PIROE2DRAFT_9106 [Piromyces sp. E2]|nr:hypothetical protein PIROE2DRAFT_9106 [Piromyces sp. E2]|eukprot:OUM64199.1 hypothetical protein PIROE2DRAFT_9106 [Piromyces sp. E2]
MMYDYEDWKNIYLHKRRCLRTIFNSFINNLQENLDQENNPILYVEGQIMNRVKPRIQMEKLENIMVRLNLYQSNKENLSVDREIEGKISLAEYKRSCYIEEYRFRRRNNFRTGFRRRSSSLYRDNGVVKRARGNMYAANKQNDISNATINLLKSCYAGVSGAANIQQIGLLKSGDLKSGDHA